MVRQYRYLLRTAPADALQAAHDEALSGPAAGVRGPVLEAEFQANKLFIRRVGRVEEGAGVVVE